MSQTNTDLLVAFEICEGSKCDSFDITDKTGVYSGTNLGGFGAPNPTVAEVDTATLLITFPDNSQLTLDLLDLSSGAFPNTSDTPFTITAAMLGVTKIEDGAYTFLLTYTGTQIDGAVIDWSSSTTLYQFFGCQTQCCIDKLQGSIKSDECNGCNDAILKRVVEATAYLNAAHKATCCGIRGKAAKLLANAKFICNSTLCKSC